MLSQALRIPRRLHHLFRKGAHITSDSYFSLKIVPSPTNQSRFSVSISKKVAPKATIRNSWRREVYQTLGILRKHIRKPVLVSISIKKIPDSIEAVEVHVRQLFINLDLF